MTEAEFRKEVNDYLNTIAYSEFFSNKQSTKSSYKLGTPDIVVGINGYYVRVECKVKNNKRTDIQTYRMNQIIKAGNIYYTLYPKDFEAFKKDMEKLLNE